MIAQQKFIRFGERIEEYEVGDLLGKGGFASVYRARCRNAGIYVAIKIINKNVMKQARMTDRVKQEVTIHARLKHPAILELYTFFEDRDFMYLVLELAENGELQQYLNVHKQINEPGTASIIKQVVDGLLYLHSNNILHRDMSLSNLLLTRDLKVKIADFGLATQLTRSDETHMTMCGTPNYISPEVASRASHGLPADVWGLGCMMYTLLVGKPPFDTDAVKSTLTKVVMSDFVLPSYLSYEAKDLISRLLQKNPTDRIRLVDVPRHTFFATVQKPQTYNNTVASADSGIVTTISSAASVQNTLPHFRCEQQFTNKIIEANAERPQTGNQFSGIFHQYQSDAEAEAEFKRFRSLELKHDSKPEIRTHYSDNALTNLPNNFNPFYAEGMVKPHMPVIDANLKPFEPILPHHQTQKPKISVPSFSTERLLPTRQKVKNAILSIQASGEVVIEFLKLKPNYKEERVVDVCRISKDGQRIIIDQPDGKNGIRGDDACPTPLSSSGVDSIFTYDNLPSKHWKKYIYASRFVQMVQAKTPKVTYYSPKAKCQLMESLQDFEVCFYDGEKIAKSLSDGCKFTDKHGNTITMSITNMDDYRSMLWDHFQQCLSHCTEIEKLLSSMQTDGNCFPAIIGRRPITVLSENVKETGSNFSTPRSHNMPSFSLSMSSIASIRPKYVQSKIHSASFVPSGRVHVPGIGIATQSAQGVLKVQYSDGTQLSVLSKEQGGGITFTPAAGIPMHYTQNDENELPELVRIRLEQMPVVLKYLKENSSKLAPSTPLNSRQNRGATVTVTPMRFIR